MIVFSPKFLGRYSPKDIVVCLSIIVAVSLIVVSQSNQWFLITLAMLMITSAQIIIYAIACAISCEQARDQANAQDRLARLRSFGPLAILSASLIIIIARPDSASSAFPGLSYPDLFFGVACLLLASAFYIYKYANWHRPKERVTNVHISKILWSYYLMNFLSGSRSILFKAFVITLFVREFHFDMSKTASLVLASSIAGFIGYRLLSVLSARLSPRLILGGAYTLVGLLFIGFALIKVPELLVVLFLLDSVLFGVSVVTDSTLKVLVSTSELPGQLSTGLAIFHAAGIVLPLTAGLILAVTESLTVIFFFAAILAWITAIASQVHCAIVARVENSITPA